MKSMENNIIENVISDRRFTDTRVGTKSKYEFSSGNTLALTGVPHGQNYLTVETSKDKGAWWFNPEEKKFSGVRITHQPSPWMGDFSYLTILPFTDSMDINFKPELSIFRAPFTKITYESGDSLTFSSLKEEAILHFEANTSVSFSIKAPGLKLKNEDDKIVGHVINMAACEDPEFKMYIVIKVDSLVSFEENEEGYILKTDKKEAKLKIATSFISLEFAKNHFESSTDDIYEMIESSRLKWINYFDRIEVFKEKEKGSYSKFERYDAEDEVSFFYHALYRCFLFPMKFYERDKNNKIFHYDTLSRSVKEGRLYTNIGFWDAQKTLFPLLSIIAREDYENMIEGIVNSYRDSGYLPKWLSPDERGLMPGTLVDNVIADALSKGIGSRYAEELLEAMIKGATVDSNNPRYGRAAVKAYEKYGYVPNTYHESVNQTLDNALSDYSISIVAKLLGKDDLAKSYEEKSKGYKKLFDEETKLLREKDENGSFKESFNPLRWGSPYTEGSAYQNSYNMYHDIDGLIDLFTSKEKFEKRLDEMFNAEIAYDEGVYGHVIHEISEYAAANFGHMAISNQPSFHLPYLYAYVDKSWKTQLMVKELMLNYFRYKNDGYPGDEDNGSLSAWYVLSAMGIYPLCPGSGEYVLGIPFFDEMRIKLSNGKVLEIKNLENYHHKKFVIERKVDDNVFDGAFISHEKLMKTRTMKHKLGIIPRV